MNAAPTTPKPQRRFRRTIAILFYSALLIWLTYITASRWNGLPADTSETSVYELPPRVPLDPRVDRTAALLAALAALPLEPFWTLPPPPEGMRWTGLPDPRIDPSTAVRGSWDPKTRPHLQAIIDHLESPAAQEALARFAMIKPGACFLTWESAREMMRVQDLLCARARYHHAGQDDIDAACDDLETLMRLAATCLNSPSRYAQARGLGIAESAQSEIRRMAFEKHLDRGRAERLIRALRSILPDEHALWQQYVGIVTSENLNLLDQSYTIDDGGNGWLVLSRLDNIISINMKGREPRSGIWNALSPLFNTRRTVAAKIASLRKGMEDADKLSSLDALEQLGKLDRSLPFNALDGPAFRWSSDSAFLRQRRMFAAHIASRRAAIASLPLSRFRFEHGEYPTSLDALLGEYLDAIPLDPFSDKPLRYFRKPGEDDYVLYSVGTNLVDDGGLKGSQFGMWADDILVDHQRSNWLDREVVLEKVDP